VDIDLKSQVLFPEKSVFYNFLDFGIGYPIKDPASRKWREMSCKQERLGEFQD
jgi:hypothetical protein